LRGKEIAQRIGFPLVIRPSFTLAGTGGAFVNDPEHFDALLTRGLQASPIHEVLIEESIFGWKEYELEVMRDGASNHIVICTIENFDPMGVHTGDSITVAPAMTLPDTILSKNAKSGLSSHGWIGFICRRLQCAVRIRPAN